MLDVVIWSSFASAAPGIAAAARELFDRFGFVFVGTVRADGTPRLSAVEVHVVDGHLTLVMVAGSRKVRDLDRDRRLVLQTPIADAGQPGSEVKLRGAVAAAEPEVRAAAATAIQTARDWRPESSWRFYEVDVHAAALMSWTPDEGDMILTRWDRQHGLRATQRRQLDMQASRYRPAPGGEQGGGRSARS